MKKLIFLLIAGFCLAMSYCTSSCKKEKQTVIQIDTVKVIDSITNAGGCHCTLFSDTWYQTAGLVRHNALLIAASPVTSGTSYDSLTIYQADSGDVNYAATTMRNLKTGVIQPITTSSIAGFKVWWSVGIPQLEAIADTQMLSQSSCLLEVDYSIGSAQISFTPKKVQVLSMGPYSTLDLTSRWFVGEDTCGLYENTVQANNASGGYDYRFAELQADGEWYYISSSATTYTFMWLRQKQ